MGERALQRARREWQIEFYLADARDDRRRDARRAAALFAAGAILAQIAAFLMTNGYHFFGFTAVALGQLAGAAIVLRAARTGRRPVPRRRRLASVSAEDPTRTPGPRE